MMRKIWVLLAIAGFVIIFIAFSRSSVNDTTESHAENYLKFTISLPSELYFAGEKVPLEYFDVYESLDREIHVNTYFQSQSIFYIKRAARFFPTIEKILQENNIPDDFKYLAVAESGLANVVSPSDAAGFWQFLKPTAIELGLEVNDKVDERFHLEKSTKAACVYLNKLYDKYGNWPMAAAAYNCGPNGLMKYVERQKEINYFNLLLTEETARYVYRILAIKLIIESPEKYGFVVKKDELYPPFDYSEVLVDTTINDLAGFANSQGTNYKLLKLLNPWLRDNVLNTNGNKKYSLKIPSKNMRSLLYNENKASQRSQIYNEEN